MILAVKLNSGANPSWKEMYPMKVTLIEPSKAAIDIFSAAEGFSASLLSSHKNLRKYPQNAMSKWPRVQIGSHSHELDS
jgi:hypothetical protein